jgi:hypothetical protein
VGLVGGLGLIGVFTEWLEKPPPDVEAAKDAAIAHASGAGLTLEGFSALVQERKLPVSDAQLDGRPWSRSH